MVAFLCSAHPKSPQIAVLFCVIAVRIGVRYGHTGVLPDSRFCMPVTSRGCTASTRRRVLKGAANVTCDEASQLVSAAAERKLSLLTRIRLRIHLFFCRPCRLFRAFVARLQHQVKRIETADLIGFPTLSDDIKNQIVATLNEQQADSSE